MAILFRPLDSMRHYVEGLTWAPYVQLSRTKVLALLQRMEIGRLVVTDCDGTVTICGDAAAGAEWSRTELTVLKEAFWVRILLFADMGFAESFMLGEFSCPDLTSFFRLFILNRARLSNATTFTSSLASTITSLARGTNNLKNAQLNVAAHYDISNATFAAFLSDDMTYSCPIWAPKSDQKCANESLEQAENRKLQYCIEHAMIKRTDHVLEIGTGWGSFAIAAVKQTGCRVTTLTLSRQQKELAEERIAAAGYMDNIEVLLCDYRALPMPKQGPYDKIVSIEMLEHVGREYLELYFQCIHKLLKPAGGIAVFQCATMPEARYEAYSRGQDFIRKYIFPGGHLSTVTQLLASIEKGSKGQLVVDSVLNVGGHYAKTLRMWKEKFERNFDVKIRPALLHEHEGMTDKDVDLFRRKWQYYFTYCEAGFNTKTLGNVILTVAREGATEMLDDIPL
ncbi:MAG: hypothetical protein Q9163_000961 [Psora crenata]